MKESFVVTMIAKLAPEFGIQVLVEPQFRQAARLTYPDGMYAWVSTNHAGFINFVGAAAIADDKAYTAWALQQAGIPIVEGGVFFSPTWAKHNGRPDRNLNAAVRYARQCGFPVFVKPNTGMKGIGVRKVWNEEEMRDVISNLGNVFLVQPVIKGREYRVVVLNGRVRFAYEKHHFTVTGDGVSTIRALVLEYGGKHMNDDPRVEANLLHTGSRWNDILSFGESLQLHDCANAAAGGSVLRAGPVHPKFRNLCERVADELGLSLCGIDLIIEGAIEDEPVPGHYCVLEANASPGLESYYHLGPEEERVVEEIFIEMIATRRG